MLEGKFDAVAPQLFTANGGLQGQIQVSDTAGFRIKQVAFLKNNTFAASVGVPVQVKRVLSPTMLIVGKVDQKINAWMPIDLSGFTVASGAYIGAEQQNNNNIPGDDHYRAIYEADPVVADRVVQVDKYGRFYDQDNPMPIIFDGTVAIGDVTVVGTAPNHYPLEPNADGSINVNIISTPIAGNTIVNTYGEALAVASGATTTVVQYTVPGGLTEAVLQRISVSGENLAKYMVFINSTQIDTRRTFYGVLSEGFEFTTGSTDGIVLNPGDQVIVKVLHNRPYIADFEGRIQVLQIT